MQVEEYASEYKGMSEEELLRLAIASSELTQEAQFALSAELSARGLKTERVEAFRGQEQERKAELAKDTGCLWFLAPWGIGRKRFGKAECEHDSEARRDRFVTTVFVVLFWLPLIPTGTYRVEKERGFWSSEDITVLERLPLSWEQVLKVWVVTAACVLALIWTFKLLPFVLIRYAGHR